VGPTAPYLDQPVAHPPPHVVSVSRLSLPTELRDPLGGTPSSIFSRRLLHLPSVRTHPLPSDWWLRASTPWQIHGGAAWAPSPSGGACADPEQAARAPRNVAASSPTLLGGADSRTRQEVSTPAAQVPNEADDLGSCRLLLCRGSSASGGGGGGSCHSRLLTSRRGLTRTMARVSPAPRKAALPPQAAPSPVLASSPLWSRTVWETMDA